MIQLGWQNISIFSLLPHTLHLSLGLLNGHIAAYLVSSLELSPPRYKPFTNRQSNENAVRAERPVAITALQTNASPLAFLTDGSSPFSTVLYFHTRCFHVH